MDHGSSHVSPGQIPSEWMSYMEILSIDAYVKEKKKQKTQLILISQDFENISQKIMLYKSWKQ